MRTALALTLLAGCAVAQTPEPPPEIWRVASIGGVAFEAETRFGLSTEAGRYQGQGPCNRFFGSVTIEPFPAVILSAPAATRMACPDLAQEATLFDALGRVERMGVSLDQMTLITANGTEIILTRR